MNSINMFFEQSGRTMFGQRFGYAVEYFYDKKEGIEYVKFAEQMIMPEDPQNMKRPQPIDLVSECIFKLIEEKKEVIVSLYKIYIRFTQSDSLIEIKRGIRHIQKSLIRIDSSATPDVKNYLQTHIWSFIQEMPVH